MPKEETKSQPISLDAACRGVVDFAGEANGVEAYPLECIGINEKYVWATCGRAMLVVPTDNEDLEAIESGKNLVISKDSIKKASKIASKKEHILISKEKIEVKNLEGEVVLTPVMSGRNMPTGTAEYLKKPPVSFSVTFRASLLQKFCKFAMAHGELETREKRNITLTFSGASEAVLVDISLDKYSKRTAHGAFMPYASKSDGGGEKKEQFLEFLARKKLAEKEPEKR